MTNRYMIVLQNGAFEIGIAPRCTAAELPDKITQALEQHPGYVLIKLMVQNTAGDWSNVLDKVTN